MIDLSLLLLKSVFGHVLLLPFSQNWCTKSCPIRADNSALKALWRLGSCSLRMTCSVCTKAVCLRLIMFLAFKLNYSLLGFFILCVEVSNTPKVTMSLSCINVCFLLRNVFFFLELRYRDCTVWIKVVIEAEQTLLCKIYS